MSGFGRMLSLLGMGSKPRFPFTHGALMQFSNDGTVWSEVRPYSETASWKLADGPGEKKVFARFRDVAGNWSGPVCATVNRPGE